MSTPVKAGASTTPLLQTLLLITAAGLEILMAS